MALSRRQREHDKQLERDKRYREKLKRQAEELKLTIKETRLLRRGRRAEAKAIREHGFNSAQHQRVANTNIDKLKARFRRIWAEQQFAENRGLSDKTIDDYEREVSNGNTKAGKYFNRQFAEARRNAERGDSEKFQQNLINMGMTHISDQAVSRYLATFISEI